MNKKKLQQKIKELEPWYHPIDFGDGVVVLGMTSACCEGRSKSRIPLKSDQRGLTKWNKYIRPNLPIDIKDASVLDIGCNSGLFSLHLLRQGAAFVRGVELDDQYVKQALFLREMFSSRDKISYNFDILLGDMKRTELYLDREFDLCLILNALRFIPDYDESVLFLTNIRKFCKTVLVQGTYKNKKDDDTILKSKLQDAGYDARLILMKGQRGVIGVGVDGGS